MEFKEALAVHLEAIKQRDLDTYKNTVHENDDVRVILLNGKEIKQLRVPAAGACCGSTITGQ